MIQFRNPDAARRAIEWAKANPERILGGSLSETSEGRSVSTMDPEATCFCLVGRVCREMGIDIDKTADGMKAMVVGYEDSDGGADELWEANDHGVAAENPLLGFRRLEAELASQ